MILFVEMKLIRILNEKTIFNYCFYLSNNITGPPDQSDAAMFKKGGSSQWSLSLSPNGGGNINGSDAPTPI